MFVHVCCPTHAYSCPKNTSRCPAPCVRYQAQVGSPLCRMEYSHRMWGRLLGFVFALPAVYFVARGAVTRPLSGRLGLLFLMGGTQGLVGWWMVKSGLQVRFLVTLTHCLDAERMQGTQPGARLPFDERNASCICPGISPRIATRATNLLTLQQHLKR